MSLRRLTVLVKKELRLMFREPSFLLIGIVLPSVLLAVFGFALSMDIKNIRLAIVRPRTNAAATELASRFQSSDFFSVSFADTSAEGSERLRRHEADACLFLPQHGGVPSIAVNATSPAIAKAYENAIASVVNGAGVHSPRAESALRLSSRVWYNEANASKWHLVPGVIVLVLALIGCMLTSLQMAKEYEQGTLESLYATPATPTEIILAKVVNNFLLGIVSLALCLLAARFVFGVPLRGSLALTVVGAAAFLLSQMALGLVISSATKSQFLSAEIAMIVSFMPVFLLSGFLYEIENMPHFLQAITCILPARWFVEFLQTVLLVGNVQAVLARDLSALAAFTLLFLAASRLLNPKKGAFR